MEKDKVMTAGQMLKAARTDGRRKREISTISKLLCISEDYLTALERCDYKAIPEVVYVLGFARNYAMELGLDPNEIVTKIKNEMGLIEQDESIEVQDVESEKVVQKDEALAEMNKNILLKNLSKYFYRNWKWLVISIVSLSIAIFSISFLLNIVNGGSDQQVSESYSTSAMPEPSYKNEVRERFGLENKNTAKVVIQANAESWVKIEDARGNTTFSRVLVKGDVYFVPGDDKIIATFGNAGGIDIWVNGNMIAKVGRDHERKSGIVLMPESLAPVAQ